MNAVLELSKGIAPECAPKMRTDRDWWRGAVIYQIYPRSFQDSNGDGIGDLPGITSRLGYIADLGVDAIWISPFFTSPMKDFGYDVSDYCDVDPMFGSLDDFDALIAEAHRLGLKVMIDQVISHSSDQHPWFAESRSSPSNPKSDWYVWADAKEDGSPPNNWLSIFGGSAWQWDTRRCQYYLHNFLASQPDLNFHNGNVQDALLASIRFWLDRGVDGFRLDTINFYFHAQGLNDNPALPLEERNATIAPAVNPYNYQRHLYDKNQPENLGFLKRFRALLDEYPAAAAVGEVGDAERGLDIVAEYTVGGDKVHMCYAFEFLAPERPTAERVREIVTEFEAKAPDGWACWAFSNHDVMRHASRWGAGIDDREAYLRMLATTLLTLRGSVCLYQGEELGLSESDVAFEDLQDPYGVEFWPTFKGRDGCRTPMVWTHNEPSGGFSTGKPWLPVDREHIDASPSQQSAKEDSLLNHYRAMLNFRASHLAFAKGTISFHEDQPGMLSFDRVHDGTTISVFINMTNQTISTPHDQGSGALLDAPGINGTRRNGTLTIPAYGAAFIEAQEQRT